MTEPVDPKAVGIPHAPVFPKDAPDPIREGWWDDPAAPGYPQMRYHDGTEWTEYVAPIRTNGPNWITRRPFTDQIEQTPEGPIPKAAVLRTPLRENRTKKKRWPWSREGA